jgi:hypothetical protein
VSLRRQKHGRQGILPFVVVMADRDDVTARAGLPLVVETFRALHLGEVASEALPAAKKAGGFDAADKLEALATLIAAGGDRIEDIRILGDDKGLCRLLGGALPSPDSLLDFLRQFHDEELLEQKPKEALAFVPGENAALLGLEKINRALVQRGCNLQTTTATVDHDGTIIESHKREAKIAYEGTRGYQPLLAVWAEEQLVLCDEFRDGNVPGGMDPLSSVKRAFAALPAHIEKRYYRGDSASYYAPLLKHLVDESIGFSISADMTEALKTCCKALAQSAWIQVQTRVNEIVEAAEVEFTPGNWPKDAKPLRYVALRITPLQTEIFSERGPKHLAIVTNRYELSAAELMQWHWQKAGTIEHVHRVMKSELGAGVMPSGRFGSNAAWLRINALTFNLLTVLKRKALPQHCRLARPKRLRFEVFTIPGRLTAHQTQLSVKVSAAEPRALSLINARQRLLLLQLATQDALDAALPN